MKSYKLLLTVAAILFLLIVSCEKEEPDSIVNNCSENQTYNSLNIEIVSPLNNIEVYKGTSIEIKVNVSDTIYQLRDIVFYKDTSLLKVLNSKPFQYDWNTTYENLGQYSIKVIAYNSIGQSDTSIIKISLITANFGIQGNGVTDIDSNHYRTVIIGQQEWMAEHLKTTHYPNGNPISLVVGNDNWTNLTSDNDAYCWYYDNVYYKDTYGALYNRVAALGNSIIGSNTNPSGIQGVCPDGWHLPSQEEWIELSDELGGGNIAKMKMKEIGTTHWDDPNVGATNESGFWALPGGYRSDYMGNSYDLGDNCYIWSSTDNFYYYLSHDNGEVYASGGNHYGFSIRCVKD